MIEFSEPIQEPGSNVTQWKITADGNQFGWIWHWTKFSLHHLETVDGFYQTYTSLEQAKMAALVHHDKGS